MKKHKITVINTGGTFSKEYDKVTGNLKVNCVKLNSYTPDKSAKMFMEEIIEKSNLSESLEISFTNIICKDSLDFNDKDRNELLKTVESISKISDNIVIIHGTDTMDISAKHLDLNLSEKIKQKTKIVFTGSMYPYRINPHEAGGNFISAVAVSPILEPGIYICIDGIVGKYDKIIKNRKKGKFYIF